MSLITGTHDHEQRLGERMNSIPASGRDIVIGRGVWIGSNAMVLGPCRIGDYAVVAAGAVVLAGTVIEPGEMYAGVPARRVKADSSLRSE